MRTYLVAMRKEKALSQAKAAEKMGVAQSYYNAIEHAERQQDMDFSIIEALARAFDTTIGAIIEAESRYREQSKEKEVGKTA